MKFYLLVDEDCCSAFLEKQYEAESYDVTPVWRDPHGAWSIFEIGSEEEMNKIEMPNMKKHILTEEAFQKVKESGINIRSKMHVRQKFAI